MSTILDVARRAGVSAATISNVLNGRTDRMRSETRARVEAAIAALDYRPNRAARLLKTGRSEMLGLLVPSIANPMYGSIAREIERVAQERFGYRLVLGNTYRDRDRETGFFDDLLDHGIRGVVVISSLVDERHYAAAIARGLVVVSYDRRSTPDGAQRIDHVSVDNFEAARLAARHLIDRGHRRLAFVTAAGTTMSRRDKIRGFLAAAHEAGLDDDAMVVVGEAASVYGDSEMAEVGRSQARVLAARGRKAPTGYVAVNDLLAFGLLAGLRDVGVDVPHQASVVGIDGLDLSSLVTPALTTVRLPIEQMAATIVERVMQRLAEPSLPAGEFLFDPSLVEGGSVARPGAAAAARKAPKGRAVPGATE